MEKSKKLNNEKDNYEQVEVLEEEQIVKKQTKAESGVTRSDLIIEIAQLVIDVIRVMQRFIRLFRHISTSA